jgi:hypothetical protein
MSTLASISNRTAFASDLDCIVVTTRPYKCKRNSPQSYGKQSCSKLQWLDVRRGKISCLTPSHNIPSNADSHQHSRRAWRFNTARKYAGLSHLALMHTPSPPLQDTSRPRKQEQLQVIERRQARHGAPARHVLSTRCAHVPLYPPLTPIPFWSF